MIHVSLYSKMVTLIVFVVFYIHYMHYVLSYRITGNSEPNLKLSSNSYVNKFLEFSDNYFPAARPFIRSRQDSEASISPDSATDDVSEISSNTILIDTLHTQSLSSSPSITPTQKPIMQSLSPKKSKKQLEIPSLSPSQSSTSNKFKKLKETITKHAKPHEMIDPDNIIVHIANQEHHYSPRHGTQIHNISQQSLIELLSCNNQSHCIVPALQLQRKVNVYLCQKPKGGGGVRFYFLIKQGLLTHPNIILIDSLNISTINEVDYIIYLPGSSPWINSECGEFTHDYSKNKTIVLEEYDGLEPLFSPYDSFKKMEQLYGKQLQYYYMYFKRSFVHRRDGRFIDFPLINGKKKPKHNVFPITYPIADDYISSSYNFHNHREIEILCTLRGSRNASSPMMTRIRAQEWVKEYVHTRNITHAITEPLNMATRTALNKAYFEHMHNTKIIVTVNPADWEGDFRLWESLASGALVFVDPLMVPYPFPLLDGVHIVYYDNHNKTELWNKLDYYLSNPLIRERVAINGYLHAMKYHRAVNLMDYILRTAEYGKLLNSDNTIISINNISISSSNYTYTGQYLNQNAIRQEKNMSDTQRPGYYRR